MEKIRIGCEIECLLLRKSFPDRTAVKDFMSDKGYVVQRDNARYDGPYTAWTVSTDNLHPASHEIEIELISPIMNHRQFYVTIPKLISDLGADIRTNEHCGWHHGLSYENDSLNRKLSQRSLYFIWKWCKEYEANELRSWGRYQHRYSLPHQVDIPDAFERHCLMYAHDTRKITTFFTRVGKGRCINITRLGSRNKYVECRVPGNIDYHKNFNKAQETVKKVLECMDATVLSDQYQNDKDFLKFLSSSCNNNPKTVDSIIGTMGTIDPDLWAGSW